MNKMRFGKHTSTYYLVFAMISAGAIGYLFRENLFVCIFATFSWAAFCVLIIDPWLYIAPKAPVYNAELRFVDINLNSSVVYMNRNGKTIVIRVVGSESKPKLSVYDNHLNGWGKACNGRDETFVELMSGDLYVHRTDTGFRVSWKEDEKWLMGIAI